MQPSFKGAIFLALTVGFTSCKGQATHDLPPEKGREVKLQVEGQPTLIKSLGSQKSDNVNSSLQDKAGNLWFGTTGEGLYTYDGNSFRQFTVADGLNSNEIFCLLEDKAGRMWIGTAAGLCLYDGKTITTVQIPLPKNLPANQNSNTRSVFSILQDKRGTLWFATIEGVYRYDGHSFTPFIVQKEGRGYRSSNPNVERILEDKAGNLWFGGRGNAGVFRYDGHSITALKPDGDNWVWPLLQAKNGHIWFSNWGGAYDYDGISFSKKAGLSTGPVTRMIEDRKGNLWIGGGRGLCRYDGKAVTCFIGKDGLVNSDVWSLLEDKTGQLWVGTRNTELYRYDGKTFTRFSEKTGSSLPRWSPSTY